MSEPNGNTLAGYGKDPLATSHGDALLDQNFQSLKSKEVRDSMSPTHELKFHSMSLNQPNTTGWDVQTSSEVSPDGRAYRTETLAQTDGVEKLNGGGLAEFKGRNEQRSSASHQGDDKNYVKKAAESSNTHLHEKVVFGDESNGRSETKVSSTTSSSTSKFVSSSTHVEHDDDAFGAQPRYLMDSQAQNLNQQQQREQQREQRELREQREREEQRFQEQLLQQQQREERYSESREQSKSTRNVETQQHYEENKRYVDMDKASPEYQRHVQHLMAQPGEIISNTVEYPKPNVKMITTVKRLPDGTIVKNKRYETEQVQPSTESVRQTQTQNNQRRVQDVHQTQNRGQARDVVDNVETVRRPTEAEEMIKQESYSSVKKSSRRFSTETTSETVEQYDDQQPQPQPQQLKAPSPAPQDFSTHGFPSVKSNKPIQEFPNHRPATPQSPRQPSNDFSTHGFPSVRDNKPTQEFLGQRPMTATDGEEHFVQSRNVKQSSSSSTHRTVETEYVGDEHVTPSWEQPASPRRAPHEDYSTHGFPSVREPQQRPRADQPDGEVIHHATSAVSRKHSATHKSNTEHIIETQVEQEQEPVLEQRRRPQPLNAQPPAGMRSAPTSKSPPRKPSAGIRTPARGVDGAATTTTTSTSSTTVTRRQLQKEREVDAAHRAFAASLRSSSPADSVGSTGSHHRRDSGHSEHHHHQHQHQHQPHQHPQRQTPRSSISSSRTYRRDGREGSHDSHAPSESSRISSTTVTRHVGVPTTKSVGKTVVTKQQQQQHTVVKTRNVQASNETIDLMPQRSPKSPKSPTTPAGTTKTTTTTTTIGSGGIKPAPASPTAKPTTVTAPKSTVPETAPTPVPVAVPASPSVVVAATLPATPSATVPTAGLATPTATISVTLPATVPASSSNETPTVSDNLSQYTYATTKPADIFSLPPTPPTINNEPTLTTTKNNNNNNHNNSKSENDSEMITKTKLSTNDATAVATGKAVDEAPCVKRHYYKLGPSDKDAVGEVTATPTGETADIIATAVTSTETVGKA